MMLDSELLFKNWFKLIKNNCTGAMYGFYLRNTCIGQEIRNTMDHKFREMHLKHVAKSIIHIKMIHIQGSIK